MKLETKVEPITSLSQQQESCSKKEVENASTLTDTVDKTFNSQASEQSSENARESVTLSTESLNVEEIQIAEEVIDEREQLSSVCTEHVQENQKDTIGKVPESALILATSQSPSLGKGKEIKKTGSESVPSSSSGSSFLSISSDGQPSSNTSVPSAEAISAHVLAMQEALNQLITMQKELQKQMSVMVAVPVAKEGKRMEAALGQRLEKVVKAHVDAMWARLQEENAKREKADRERVQQLTSLLNSINKDLPMTLERVLKKEIGSLGPTVARIVTPTLEKTISTAINDSFQKGVSDKALAQLEKSVVTKLDSLVSRQIQTQFQSSGKQVLQDTLRSSFENSIIPAFERSSKAMFDQVDSAFQKGMAEHTTAAQQQFATTHTVLASTLQDAVASASSLAQSLKGELADGQRRLLALAEGAGASSARLPTFNTKQGNSGLGGLPDKKAISLKHLEESLDPTKELSRLVSERKFEEAFHKALQMSDVSIVSWLCTQADPQSLFSMVPLPLSQGVLLSLVQQLSCDLGKDTARKLVWIREAALALNPNDPILAHHMRPILGDLYQNLHGQMLITSSGGEASSIRLVLHLVNSILTACK
jgi:enhancer of mRNA-decapping protein 4